MPTEKIGQILRVTVKLLKTNPPSLLIIAKGHNGNNNFTNIRLEPRVYVTPPPDGIWEFDMVGDAPTFVDTIGTNVSAEYVWKAFPKEVKGVKVYGNTNNMITMLNSSVTAEKAVEPTAIQIIKAEAWVNMQPIPPTPGGTLIVNIDYNSNDHGFHNLQFLKPQGINPKILMLEITHSSELIFIVNPRHNTYSQGLETSSQYSSIELYYEGNKVGSIDKIPIVT